MVGIALSIVGGIVAAASGCLSAGLASAIAVLLLLLSFALIRSKASTGLVFATVACVAACRFLVEDPSVSKASITWELDRLPKRGVELVGRISDFPVYRPYRSGTGGMWTFPLECEGIRDSTGWKKLRGEIDVRILGSDPEPIVCNGQQVKLHGELQKRNYPGGKGIGLKVASPSEIAILTDAPRFSPTAWSRHWRDSAAKRLAVGMDGMDEQQAIVKALVLGDRKDIPPATIACFRRTGSMHIFAISGLHVGIVGLLLAIVLKSCGIPRDWFGVWLLPLLFLYVLSTGMKASALRAMVMAGVFLLAPLFRRKPDIPSSVAFAAILLLLLDPLELMSPGFVFSFVVVAFIVMVYSVVPRSLMQGGWIKSYSLSLVITSLAASLASMPMTALYFSTFSPIALLCNLAVVPLTFCIVLSGWLSILIPMASSVFNHAAAVFVKTMTGCVVSMDRIPGSSWKVDPPPLMAVLLWYCSLIYLLVHANRKQQRVCAMAGAGCAVLWAVLA